MATWTRGEVDFETRVIPDEILDINVRRRALGRPELPVDMDFSEERQMLDAVGLALSGGGIRSASFCLGVLQALNHAGAMDKVDYLSTVSGGGYIGTSLSATMTATGGKFAYGSAPAAGGTPPPVADTAAVGHIRNYSNYLIPFGFRDVRSAMAIVARGLAANLAPVIGIMLLAAAITAAIYPRRSSLPTARQAGVPIDSLLSGGTWSLGQFGLTYMLALLLPVLFFAWALFRSFLPPAKLPEFRTSLPALGGYYLLIVAAAAFVEVQPFVVEGMFHVADAQTIAAASGAPERSTGPFFGLVAEWVQWLAMVLAPVTALVALFRKNLGDIIAASSATAGLKTRLAGLAAIAVVWIAGLALPLLVWVGYLYLAYWAIPNDTAPPVVPAVACPQDSVSGALRFGPGDSLTAGFDGTVTLDRTAPCAETAARTLDRGWFDHTPAWIIGAAGLIDGNIVFGPFEPVPAPRVLYFYLGALLIILALFLRPNANSLHRLYRDRLSKAFLFHPERRVKARQSLVGRRAGQEELQPLDTVKLTDIQASAGPYQLINAALNIQGSDFSNRRGRNADFFLFSRLYTGSVATGYAGTDQMQTKAPDLDLATAMAISGAAASSNMGSKSVRALTPTLALLNVRLGYWLPNPFFAYRGEEGDVSKDFRPRWVWSYLWAEVAGRLNEDSNVVYVTDGGHIENLGVYELLRRRCKLIVAVDAEADPEMRFPSLVALERYARIDLGVRISLPWQTLAETTRAWMGVGSRGKPKAEIEATRGPHVVVGTIDYGVGTGYLVYVKASLSGDEPDYVRDYARRHARFPHETTGDQFFNEEQFEVYRALGFHAMTGFFAGTHPDDVVVEESLVPPATPAAPPTATAWATGAAPLTTPAPGPKRATVAPGVIVPANHAALAPIHAMLA